MSPCTQIYDDEFGYLNKPNAKFIESFEGYSAGKFNRLGFNDMEPKVNGNTTPIFIVGDSYTEAFQVNLKKHYSQILEDKYNNLFPGKQIDIIKLCRDGFMPVHYFKIIDKYIAQFNPELIILQLGYHSGSDLFSAEVKPILDKRNKLVDLVTIKKREDLQKEKYRSIISTSALSYFIIRKQKKNILRILNKFNFRSKSELSAVNSKLSSSPKTDNEMIKRFEIIFDKLKFFNKKLLILYIPKPGGYLPGNKNYKDKTFKALQVAAKFRDIDILSIENEFEKFFKATFKPVNGFLNSLPGNGHLNKLGHKVIGEKLVNYLINDS